MNYSTLLNRSVDFDEYAVVLRDAYPNALDQQLVFGMIQMLWDSGETSGYVQHLTDRVYDLTPPKEVLMTVAFGDHQVANITVAEHRPHARHPDVPPGAADRLDDRARRRSTASTRSGRSPTPARRCSTGTRGTLAPPLGNITPIMSQRYIADCTGANADQVDSPRCADPHEDPRRQPEVIDQKKAFFQPEGTITNVCRDQPCIAKPADDFDY